MIESEQAEAAGLPLAKGGRVEGTSCGPVAECVHAVAYRVSLPLLGSRYYFAFFAGHEQRTDERLVAECQRRSWVHTTVSLSAMIMLSATMLMCTLAAVYLAKSMLGIDLFDDHFFLHNLFFS